MNKDSCTKDLFAQLSSLTQLYLLQEYSAKDLVETNEENYLFFKELAKKTPPAIKPLPNPSQVPTPSSFLPPEHKPLAAQKPYEVKQEKTSSAVEKIDPPSEVLQELPLPKNLAKTDLSASKEEKQTEKYSGFDLKPLGKAKGVDLFGIKEAVLAQFPEFIFLEDILENQNLKKPDIYIFFSGEPQEEKNLIYNIAKALALRFKPAAAVNIRMIEKNNSWKDWKSEYLPKLIILETSYLKTFPNLAKNITELEDQRCFFDDTPVFLMSSPSAYLKNPTLKIALWKDLCKTLQ